MREFVLLSFIIFASTSIGYRVGYHMGNGAVATEQVPIEQMIPIPVKVDFHQNVKKIDDWFFPCNVIHIEITERDKKDEDLSIELNESLKRILIDKSTFTEYCHTTGIRHE